MKATIQKWGNSNAVRIPKIVLAAADLKEKDTVQIITKQNEIIIRKAKKTHRTWAERFEGHTVTYEAGEFDTSAVGEERFWEQEASNEL
jgi:antitoxin MazE